MRRNERHYLVITTILDKRCEMYDLGSSHSYAKMMLVKLANIATKRGLSPVRIGTDMLIIYDDVLNVRSIAKVFTTGVP